MHSSLLRVLVTSLRVLVTSHAASASVHETRSSNAVYSTKFASECDVTLELYCMYIRILMFFCFLHVYLITPDGYTGSKLLSWHVM